MPISVQQYRLGIIHYQKRLKYNCYDQKPNIDDLMKRKKTRNTFNFEITLV